MHFLKWKDVNRIILKGVVLQCDMDHFVWLPRALESLRSMYERWRDICKPEEEPAEPPQPVPEHPPEEPPTLLPVEPEEPPVSPPPWEVDLPGIEVELKKIGDLVLNIKNEIDVIPTLQNNINTILINSTFITRETKNLRELIQTNKALINENNLLMKANRTKITYLGNELEKIKIKITEVHRTLPDVFFKIKEIQATLEQIRTA